MKPKPPFSQGTCVDASHIQQVPWLLDPNGKAQKVSLPFFSAVPVRCCGAERCDALLECSLGEQMLGCGSSQRLLQALFQVASISGLTFQVWLQPGEAVWWYVKTSIRASLDVNRGNEVFLFGTYNSSQQTSQLFFFQLLNMFQIKSFWSFHWTMTSCQSTENWLLSWVCQEASKADILR